MIVGALGTVIAGRLGAITVGRLGQVRVFCNAASYNFERKTLQGSNVSWLVMYGTCGLLGGTGRPSGPNCGYMKTSSYNFDCKTTHGANGI